MKDKLVKSHRGRFYYRSMSFLRGLGLTLAALVVLSAPVVIAYGVNVAETRAAAEESSHPAPSSSEDSIPTASYRG